MPKGTVSSSPVECQRHLTKWAQSGRGPAGSVPLGGRPEVPACGPLPQGRSAVALPHAEETGGWKSHGERVQGGHPSLGLLPTVSPSTALNAILSSPDGTEVPRKPGAYCHLSPALPHRLHLLSPRVPKGHGTAPAGTIPPRATTATSRHPAATRQPDQHPAQQPEVGRVLSWAGPMENPLHSPHPRAGAAVGAPGSRAHLPGVWVAGEMVRHCGGRVCTDGHMCICPCRLLKPFDRTVVRSVRCRAGRTERQQQVWKGVRR